MRITIKNMICHKLAKHGFTVSGLHIPMMYAVVFLLLSSTAFAATVTNTDDSGQGSLRFAVENASEGETIDFSVAGTIQLTEQIIIDKELTIRGPGQELLIMDGNSITRTSEGFKTSEVSESLAARDFNISQFRLQAV